MANIKRTGAKEADRKFKSDLDKVEAAFRKLDKDGDGFIDWEEFKEVSKDLDSEEAKDIFEACDKVIWSHFPLSSFPAPENALCSSYTRSLSPSQTLW